MEQLHSNTIETSRKPGKHLTLDERGIIQALHQQGHSLRYISIRIPGRTTDGVEVAISQLEEQYGSKHFSTVFKTMTADNGPEFTTFSKLESLGNKVYFVHPYSSWECPQNERHNGLLREFIPKGTSIEQHTDDDILDMADTLNQRPRRILDYHSPAELFEAFLDEVYAIDNIYWLEKCSISTCNLRIFFACYYVPSE